MRLHILILTIVLAASPSAFADGGGLLRACVALFAPQKSAIEEEISAKEDRAWDNLRPQIATEMAIFRSLPKNEKQAYLEKVSDSVTSYLEEVFHTDNLGFHYNLHGGGRDSYITGGGIHATQGDIATQLGHARDYSKKVYFFQSQQVGLLKVLDSTNPAFLFPRTRMGHVLILMDLNAPIMKRLEADGVIRNKQSIYFEVDDASPRSLKSSNGSPIGVPAEAFVLPPLSVFTGISAKTGINRLNWDEQTLVMMRFIEQMAKDSQQGRLN
ncbi:MAG: hypothetical protein KDD37_09220 [Bdellovibrionales bacterium]|nr:hypothetical protein [Bdellovibrionales bacterium]